MVVYLKIKMDLKLRFCGKSFLELGVFLKLYDKFAQLRYLLINFKSMSMFWVKTGGSGS